MGRKECTFLCCNLEVVITLCGARNLIQFWSEERVLYETIFFRGRSREKKKKWTDKEMSMILYIQREEIQRKVPCFLIHTCIWYFQHQFPLEW